MMSSNTTKHKDEPETPKTMSTPLSSLINGAKSQPAASATTLTPGMEAMHLTTISPFATATQTTPITSITPDRPFTSFSPPPRLTREEYLHVKQLHANAVKVLRQKGILLFFGAARAPDQITAAKHLDESILKIKHAAELQARTADEEEFLGYHALLIRLLMKANREFVSAYEAYKEATTGWPLDVWCVEVKEIGRLVGAWEEGTEGRWPVLTKCLRGLDGKIAEEYRDAQDARSAKEYLDINSEIREIWNLEVSGEDGDEKDDGAKSDGAEVTGGKTLAEELEVLDSASDVSSVDEGDESADKGDESMEYISPSKVLTKEERSDEEEETDDADAVSDLSSSPSQLVDLSFNPSKRAARSKGLRSPGSSTPKRMRTVSPDSPAAQSLLVADIPSTSFDFTFGPALHSAKPLQPSPAISISNLFGAAVPVDTTTKLSRLPLPVQDTPTTTTAAMTPPLAKNTMSDSASPLTPVPATEPITAAPVPLSFATASQMNEKVYENTVSEPEEKEYYCKGCKAEWTVLQVLGKRGSEGFLCHKCDFVLVFDSDYKIRGEHKQSTEYHAQSSSINPAMASPQSTTPVQNKSTTPAAPCAFGFDASKLHLARSPSQTPAQPMTALSLPTGTFDFKFGSATTATPTPSDLPASNKWTYLDNYVSGKPNKLAFATAATPEASAFSIHDSEKGEGTQALTSSTTKFPANPSPHSIFGSKSLTSLSTPPITPSLSSFAEANTTQKGGGSLSNKPPTASTLTELTRTIQTIQTGLNNLLSAIYGFDTTTQAPQTAMNAGLLMMNNFIGEWVADIRIQIKTLDTKLNEIGNRLHSLGLEFTHVRDENLLFTSQALQKEERDIAAIKEINEMITKQMNQLKEMQEQYQSGLSSLLAQNAKLTMEVAALTGVKSLSEEEIRNLRIDNMMFRELVERFGGKIEKVIDRLVEKEVEVNEEEDALMQMLWPQGDGRLDAREGVETKVLERAVLADGRGKQGGGWCSVM